MNDNLCYCREDMLLECLLSYNRMRCGTGQFKINENELGLGKEFLLLFANYLSSDVLHLLVSSIYYDINMQFVTFLFSSRQIISQFIF